MAVNVHWGNNPVQLIPLEGTSDATFTVTSSSQLLPTLNASCEAVRIQVLGGHVRQAYGATADQDGYLWPEGSSGVFNPTEWASIRVIRDADSAAASIRYTQMVFLDSNVRYAAGLSEDLAKITFDEVYNYIRRMHGLPEGSDFQSHDAEAIAQHVQIAITTGWRKDWWPKLTLTEERDTTDADGGLYVPWSETGKVNLGEIEGVYIGNPLTSSTARPVHRRLSSRGVEVLGEAAETVFIRHRLVPPRFTRTAFDAGTSYAAGAVVYWATTGNCYQRLSAGSTATPADVSKWELQIIPEFLGEYVKNAALALSLDKDGQQLRRNTYAKESRDALSRAQDVEVGAQGQADYAVVNI